MKKLLLLLNIFIVSLSFSQKKTKYDCSFSAKDRKGYNYTLTTKENDNIRVDYYNSIDILLKTENFKSKTDMANHILNGPQILYNYDGTVFSSGSFNIGNKDGLWEIHRRDGVKIYTIYQSGKVIQSTTINTNADTSLIEYFETITSKNRCIRCAFYSENGKPDKIKWYDYQGEDSVTRFMKNDSITLNYKDSPESEDSLETEDSVESDTISTTNSPMEKMPIFKGRQNAFSEFISNNLNYPENLARQGICGIVEVMFEVDTNGSVNNVKVTDILPSQHPELEKEAVRLVKKTNGLWEPGQQKGENVKVLCRLPIEFTF